MKFMKQGKSSTRTLGSQGERLAADYLERNGYRILARSFRTRYGEVDIIAADGDIIAFVEVKLRRSSAYGSPGEAIDRRKQMQIAEVARYFLSSRRFEEVPCRFDSVLISHHDADDTFSCELVKDAFRLE